jgi:hypothetical protein
LQDGDKCHFEEDFLQIEHFGDDYVDAITVAVLEDIFEGNLSLPAYVSDDDDFLEGDLVI